MKTAKKVSLKDLNCVLLCNLCGGYYVDATTLVDCMHAFCRSCILRHFENKLACPTCNTVYKKKNHSCLRQDLQLQTLVYKLVPGLFAKEMQRREDFYRSTGVRASSSCSDDSVLGDMMHDPEEWIHINLGEDNQFLSPDDSISLSLEYYQHHLDNTSVSSAGQNVGGESDKGDEQIATDATVKTDEQVEVKTDEQVEVKTEEQVCVKEDDKEVVKNEEAKVKDRRYLQCPAAVSMTHLQKFLRMKYALSAEHKVDVIYEGEVLPSHFSLIDVAYTFKWQRTKPMRFFYRIFTPMKIRPIKIINTSSTGQKQLQIVPVTPTSERTPPAIEPSETEAQNQRNKERLMAELQLQSKSKAAENAEDQKNSQNLRYGKTYESSKSEKRKHAVPQSECVYDYDEQDKEEMKRFAEKRDREWQMQKHLDVEEEPRVSKKRKKSKHSKSDSSKKRKLHAEITSEVSNKEESIKLKVKLTPHNGHKHKHHKNQLDRPSSVDVSSKEKLLQMRQIRHKSISVEDKCSQALTQNFDKIKKTKSSSENTPSETKGEFTITIAKSTEKAGESRIKPTEARTKTSETQTKTSETQMKSSETQTKSSETQTIISQSKPPISAKTNEVAKEMEAGRNPAEVVVSSGKTLRSDFSFKTNATKDLCAKQTATVQIERNEMMERQAQKTFLRTFPSHADKYSKITEKIPTVKVENVCKKLTDQAKSLHMTKSINLNRLHLQQKLDHTTAPAPKPEKKVTFNTTSNTLTNDTTKTPHILNSQYHTHSGFTVSKIETGVKRKSEVEENMQDKRPSLEITLINPPTTTTMSVTAPPKQSATPAKRPPPPTIPLDRIKKSITLKSGISIIPKMPEKCDNIGALDLSKPHKSTESLKHSDLQTKINGLATSAGNGLKQISASPGRVLTPDKNMQLSNLQMLSKVASEHPNLNKPLHTLQAKPRPQMPSLQTLKIPNPQQQQQNKSSNLAKLPKLNEINKSQFRMVNTLRNMRPNQNQSIRNIPNPSLLVRQQNQNRLNSLNSTQSGPDVKEEVKTPTAVKDAESVGDAGKSGESTDASAATTLVETGENV